MAKITELFQLELKSITNAFEVDKRWKKKKTIQRGRYTEPSLMKLSVEGEDPLA